MAFYMLLLLAIAKAFCWFIWFSQFKEILAAASDKPKTITGLCWLAWLGLKHNSDLCWPFRHDLWHRSGPLWF